MKKKYILLLMLAFVMTILSCDEAFPPRMVPSKIIVLRQALATYDVNNIDFSIVGENIYEETLQDTVDISGKIHLWWKKRSEIQAVIELTNQNFIVPPTRIIPPGILTMDPGERFFIKARWNLITDNGYNIIDLLEFPPELIVNNISKSKPEVFIFNVELNLFDQATKIELKYIEFTYQAWKLKTPSL